MPADFSGSNRFARDLFGPLPARYDSLAEILSFGQNGRWRSAMVDHVLPTGDGWLRADGDGALRADGDGALRADGDGARMGDAVRADGDETETEGGVILDVASGTAGVALLLEARSGVKVVGVDLTEEMLRQGHRRVVAAGRAERIGLVAGRAEQLPFPARHFDALTFTYLLRYVQDPQATLAELARVLRPGGTMASLEFCVPAGGLWRPAWWAYTRMLLPAGGLLLGGREWYRVGRFLGPNISAHYRRYPVSWTVRAWEKAGFTDVGVRVMSLGGGLVMWGTRATA
jgi:demethylmenaquinone methyltransferase / 2-methoxy-6-polyprenyl-1,4-benzoquinol methylase